MILSSARPFKKEEPSEEAKKFVIVCEGAKREADYFRYFEMMDSRIEVEIISPEDGDNNSPTGLIEKVRRLTSIGPEGEKPEYELTADDEIWFVIDTDTWGDKIEELRAEVAAETKLNMFVAQSNPCFEVWLCYHFSGEVQDFLGMNEADNWKTYLPTVVKPGGFDSKKHPILIRQALDSAKENYQENEAREPALATTQVFKLAEKIYAVIGKKIDSALLKMTRE